MTNSTDATTRPIREDFKKMMCTLGVHAIEGVEVLRMVRICANTFEAVTGDKMRSENMTESRWRLLLRLHMEEMRGNREVNPSQLADMHHVSKNTISSLLRSLDEQGLIIQVLDREDRRKFKVCLSEEGKRQVQASLPRHVEYLQRLTSELSTEEVEQLLTLLGKLHDSILRNRNTDYPKSPSTATVPPVQTISQATY